MKKGDLEINWLVAFILVILILIAVLIMIFFGGGKMGELVDRIFEMWRFGG